MFKRVFGVGPVLMTLLSRVCLKLVFACLCFNLVQLVSLVESGNVSYRSGNGEEWNYVKTGG